MKACNNGFSVVFKVNNTFGGSFTQLYRQTIETITMQTCRKPLTSLEKRVCLCGIMVMEMKRHLNKQTILVFDGSRGQLVFTWGKFQAADRG